MPAPHRPATPTAGPAGCRPLAAGPPHRARRPQAAAPGGHAGQAARGPGGGARAGRGRRRGCRGCCRGCCRCGAGGCWRRRRSGCCSQHHWRQRCRAEGGGGGGGGADHAGGAAWRGRGCAHGSGLLGAAAGLLGCRWLGCPPCPQRSHQASAGHPCRRPAEAQYSEDDEEEEGGGAGPEADPAARAGARALPSDVDALRALLGELPWWAAGARCGRPRTPGFAPPAGGPLHASELGPLTTRALCRCRAHPPTPPRRAQGANHHAGRDAGVGQDGAQLQVISGSFLGCVSPKIIPKS